MQPRPTLFVLLLGLAVVAAPTRGDTRADFLKVIEKPRTPLAPEVGQPVMKDGIERVDFSYAAEPGERVPSILVKAAGSSGRRPVVIALHGTGGNKESHLAFMTDLAKAGFVAVSIDNRYHGARSKAGKGSVEYVDAILRSFHDSKEHPFFFDTAWDVMRLIDYLETRPDVDPKRIGIFGTSKGGIECYLTAPVEPRIACIVSCIGVESFRWAAENNSWQSRIGTVQKAFDAAAKERGVAKPDGEFVHAFYSRVAPGIDREFDGPAMVPLAAPRPFLAINGEIDPRTPAPGLMLCADAARAAYKAAGAEDRFVLHIQKNTAHKVNPESLTLAKEWFVRWLGP